MQTQPEPPTPTTLATPTTPPTPAVASASGPATASLVLGLVSLTLWFVPTLGMIVPVVGLTLGAVAGPARKRSRFTGIVCSALGLLLALVVSGRPLLDTFRGRPMRADYALPAPNALAPAQPGGLSLKQAQLTCATLECGWVVRHPMTDDEGGGGSSAVVLGNRPGMPSDRIYLATNKHCLCIPQLSSATDGWFAQGIASYALRVTLPSGKQVPVLRVADTLNGDLDLAFLEIDAAGLAEGVDYVKASIPESAPINTGEAVLAIGSPLSRAFAGSVTQGIVSSIRPQTYPNGSIAWNWIQHTAAVNHGNSGGPLFVERSGTYWWIGINTAIVGTNTQGMFVAIQSDVVGVPTTNYFWASADAAGAVQIMAKEGHSATLAK